MGDAIGRRAAQRIRATDGNLLFFPHSIGSGEEAARLPTFGIRGGLGAWQGVREAAGVGKEVRRRGDTDGKRILSVEKLSKQKKMKMKKTKAETARAEKTRAAETLRAKVQEKINKKDEEKRKLVETIEKATEEVECPVCCEEMAPPRTIWQCAEGHPVCSSCRPRLDNCPSCRGAFMGRARGMERLVQAILNKEAE